jgi:hypothetical protein
VPNRIGGDVTHQAVGDEIHQSHNC